MQWARLEFDMTDILKDYFEALERLKREKPVNVPKLSLIHISEPTRPY